MAILPIRIYPDPALRTPALPVESFDGELSRLAGDMIETMYAAPGIGLAAPQVGRGIRLAVVDLSVGEDPEGLHVLVNPELVDEDGSEVELEGCLSIPGISEKVVRPASVRVRAQRIDGQPIELTAQGWLARAVCHEIDHLNGVLFVDHLRGLRRERVRRQLRRLKLEQEAPA